MRLGPHSFWDHRVRSFLYTVMHEAKRVLGTDDQVLVDRIPKFCFGLAFRSFEHGRKRGYLYAVSNARKLLKSSLGRRGKAFQLANHQLYDIVGVRLGAYGMQIPDPAANERVELDQRLVHETLNELD